MLFAVSDARTIYLSRIAHSRQEITSTLSLGVTLDHAVSMSIPAFAGWVWMAWGYPRVFLGAAAIALATLVAASRVPPRVALPPRAEGIPPVAPREQ